MLEFAGRSRHGLLNMKGRRASPQHGLRLRFEAAVPCGDPNVLWKPNLRTFERLRPVFPPARVSHGVELSKRCSPDAYVQEAALWIAQGVASPEMQELAANLEKATRCSIAKMAVHAEQWPES
jgi:hypothetical protein